MSPTETILGSLVIAFASGLAGKYMGSNGKVKDSLCEERRHMCSEHMVAEFKNVKDSINKLEKTINDKLIAK